MLYALCSVLFALLCALMLYALCSMAYGLCSMLYTPVLYARYALCSSIYALRSMLHVLPSISSMLCAPMLYAILACSMLYAPIHPKSCFGVKTESKCKYPMKRNTVDHRYTKLTIYLAKLKKTALFTRFRGVKASPHQKEEAVFE